MLAEEYPDFVVVINFDAISVAQGKKPPVTVRRVLWQSTGIQP